MKRNPAPVSLRHYAKIRGVSHTAVIQAKKHGRLKKCLTDGGKIRSVEEADAEWKATTHSDRVPLGGPTAPQRPTDDADFSEARARLELAKAQLAEFEVAKRRGELIAVAELEARLVTLFASCKTKLLGIPSRARQADPTLSSVQVAIVESLVREALEDLAEGKLEVEAA
jgi:phage terminase Nu1 subunit (DNA packaging protein)